MLYGDRVGLLRVGVGEGCEGMGNGGADGARCLVVRVLLISLM